MLQDIKKSILDNTAVTEKGFPLSEQGKYTNAHQQPLVVVSACPKCGAPVYGKKTVTVGEVPPVTHSCTCSVHKDIQSIMQTK